MRDYLTAADVARGFRRSVTWFYAKRPDLEAAGFPRPVDRCGMRWDPRAIEIWQNAQCPVPPPGPEQQAEHTLIERAQRMAAPS